MEMRRIKMTNKKGYKCRIILYLFTYLFLTGEFVVFHPLLEHQGAVYDAENTRLHIYMDHPQLKRPVDDAGNVLTFFCNNKDPITGKIVETIPVPSYNKKITELLKAAELARGRKRNREYNFNRNKK